MPATAATVPAKADAGDGGLTGFQSANFRVINIDARRPVLNDLLFASGTRKAQRRRGPLSGSAAVAAAIDSTQQEHREPAPPSVSADAPQLAVAELPQDVGGDEVEAVNRVSEEERRRVLLRDRDKAADAGCMEQVERMLQNTRAVRSPVAPEAFVDSPAPARLSLELRRKLVARPPARRHLQAGASAAAAWAASGVDGDAQVPAPRGAAARSGGRHCADPAADDQEPLCWARARSFSSTDSALLRRELQGDLRRPLCRGRPSSNTCLQHESTRSASKSTDYKIRPEYHKVRAAGSTLTPKTAPVKVSGRHARSLAAARGMQVASPARRATGPPEGVTGGAMSICRRVLKGASVEAVQKLTSPGSPEQPRGQLLRGGSPDSSAAASAAAAAVGAVQAQPAAAIAEDAERPGARQGPAVGAAGTWDWAAPDEAAAADGAGTDGVSSQAAPPCVPRSGSGPPARRALKQAFASHRPPSSAGRPPTPTSAAPAPGGAEGRARPPSAAASTGAAAGATSATTAAATGSTTSAATGASTRAPHGWRPTSGMRPRMEMHPEPTNPHFGGRPRQPTQVERPASRQKLPKEALDLFDSAEPVSAAAPDDDSDADNGSDDDLGPAVGRGTSGAKYDGSRDVDFSCLFLDDEEEFGFSPEFPPKRSQSIKVTHTDWSVFDKAALTGTDGVGGLFGSGPHGGRKRRGQVSADDGADAEGCQQAADGGMEGPQQQQQQQEQPPQQLLQPQQQQPQQPQQPQRVGEQQLLQQQQQPQQPQPQPQQPQQQQLEQDLSPAPPAPQQGPQSDAAEQLLHHPSQQLQQPLSSQAAALQGLWHVLADRTEQVTPPLLHDAEQAKVIRSPTVPGDAVPEAAEVFSCVSTTPSQHRRSREQWQPPPPMPLSHELLDSSDSESDSSADVGTRLDGFNPSEVMVLESVDGDNTAPDGSGYFESLYDLLVHAKGASPASTPRRQPDKTTPVSAQSQSRDRPSPQQKEPNTPSQAVAGRPASRPTSSRPRAGSAQASARQQGSPTPVPGLSSVTSINVGSSSSQGTPTSASCFTVGMRSPTLASSPLAPQAGRGYLPTDHTSPTSPSVPNANTPPALSRTDRPSVLTDQPRPGSAARTRQQAAAVAPLESRPRQPQGSRPPQVPPLGKSDAPSPGCGAHGGDSPVPAAAPRIRHQRPQVSQRRAAGDEGDQADDARVRRWEAAVDQPPARGPAAERTAPAAKRGSLRPTIAVAAAR